MINDEVSSALMLNSYIVVYVAVGCSHALFVSFLLYTSSILVFNSLVLVELEIRYRLDMSPSSHSEYYIKSVTQ